jgi:hypothetical protein
LSGHSPPPSTQGYTADASLIAAEEDARGCREEGRGVERRWRPVVVDSYSKL